MSASDSPAVPELPRPLQRQSVATTVIGNFVEYFDWLAYGLFAPLFARQFFPSSNQLTSLLGAYAVFALGMLCRPLGGIVLGRLADRRGRKPALMVSIALMAAGSALIAISPTYQQIGLVAPLILLLARSAQGFSSGGEWPAAVTYLMELAPANRRCFYGGLFSMSAASGAFVAALLGGGLTAWLGRAAMVSWGWRVPFIVGAVFGVILLLARNRLTETDIFQREVRAKESRGSLRLVLTTYRRQVLLVVLFVAGLTAVVGTWTTAVPAFGQKLAPPGMMFWVIVLVTGVTIVIQPPLGLLADLVGVPRFLTVTSVAFLFVGTFTYLNISGNFGNLVLTYGSGVIYMGCVTAVMPKVLAGVFPADIRGLGIGLPHATTTAVLGGVTPLLATFLYGRGASGWFIAGVMATVVLGWLAATIATRRSAVVVVELSTQDEEQDQGPTAKAA